MITCILLVKLDTGREGKSQVEGYAGLGRDEKKKGEGRKLTLRGSPSPDPESWSRREPPPGLGSVNSTPSMKTASGVGCLFTRGCSATWKPNSDAKGIYIRGKECGRGRGGGGIKAVMGTKGAKIKSG